MTTDDLAARAELLGYIADADAAVLAAKLAVREAQRQRGALLLEAIDTHGLTHADLAAQLGITRQAVGKLASAARLRAHAEPAVQRSRPRPSRRGRG